MIEQQNHTPGSGQTTGTVNTVAVIGNYLPRRCGIATFTADFAEGLTAVAANVNCWAVAMNDSPKGYQYPSRVRFEINQNRPSEYEQAADFLNMNRVDIVSLQHEYGIFGGQRGSYILTLLEDLQMPVVTTLHTILNEPTRQEREIINKLAILSDKLVVMSRKGETFLREIYGIPEKKIAVIPHGIPNSPFVDPTFFKDKFGVPGKTVILTFGLLSPGKGIEYMISALPKIVETHPEVIYFIAGATHPHVKQSQGEDYRLSLHRLAKELGVDEHVVFYDSFVPVEELVEFIGATDIYVTPYLNEKQIVSGTLAYSLGMGKAVVSTPYWHAQELLADGRGKLVPFRDSSAIAKEIINLLNNPEQRNTMRKNAYLLGREMTWEKAALRYLDLFRQVKDEQTRKHIPGPRLKTLKERRQRLPEISLNHMKILTDDTGIMEHAKYTVPSRVHGYCVDDNARALIVSVLASSFGPDSADVDYLVARYMSFLYHAFNDSTGRFRNHMTYGKEWLKEESWEDAHGRALWALGTTVSLSKRKGYIQAAANLFSSALHTAEGFEHPRAMAYALIGVHAYLSLYSGDSRARRIREVLANRLMERFLGHATDEWPWFEDRLTYANARIPHALMLSGQWMQNGPMLEMGLKTLRWLKEVQTDPRTGYFTPIGCNGWYRRDGEKARYDQQPVEAAVMIDACFEAFNCTREKEWISYAYRCINWFMGENDRGMLLYDYTTGGCRDGLEAQGVNENQGAESTISWLNSLLMISIRAGVEEVAQDKTA